MLGPDECWLWAGGKQRRYRYKGHSALAHRVAYELYYGQELAAGVHVKHTCGNSFCCNGLHLKAPHQPSACGRTLFTEAEKQAMREERAAGATLQEIRKKWGADTRTLLLLNRL